MNAKWWCHLLDLWRRDTDGPDIATCRRSGVMFGGHAGRHVAVSLSLDASDIDEVPETTTEVNLWTQKATVKAWRVLHWRTLQTRLLPPLQKTRRMTPECCRRLSGGSDKEETCGVRVTKEERVQKQKPSWHGCRYLAGGNCFVPLGHFLWLKDHLLIHQLSRTLHKGLDKTTATVSKTRERSGVVLIWAIFCLFSCNMFHCVYLNNDNISNSSKDWVIFTGFTNTLKID